MLPDPAPATAFHRVMDLKNYSPVAPEESKPIPPAPVTPNAIKENIAPPKRPMKRLSGKQMIRMDAPESPVVPKKRNNTLSKKSKIVCSNLKVNSVIFCRSCRNNVSIDGNRKLLAQFCGRCRICTC
ncbi:hypothetical protein B9Z55_028558 [Caenorhabditis nigoni]|uniref:Uncharacterized protein n=1 Tax=Caenorhabditis nigoni TaxID=1611254 RepID=A0A2G5SAT7_9PELO|nr:hypothetical protein B9Z55_028553 [Caenorhabditis nigoni]PIC12204.1 hypothetical protein B9Z55_028558 [Caenorhabditis nigoni]